MIMSTCHYYYSGIFNNASRAPSRAQSRFKLGSTFDPLSARSSRTFLGSKSSLASSSRKNLVSESMRSLKNQAQVKIAYIMYVRTLVSVHSTCGSHR